MKMGNLSALIYGSKTPLPFPVLTLPGARLIDEKILKLFTDSGSQIRAARAVRQTFGLPFWQLGMDLSVEAEEFGCELRFAEDESPSILGRLVSDELGAKTLSVPRIGSKRSAVYLETLRALVRDRSAPFVVGGAIGPFSLTGRIFGLSEALLATVMEPDTVFAILEKAASFIIAYATAQRDSGAVGIILAEPSAGLLSPEALSDFSGAYLKRIVDAVQTPDFEIVLHNCAATTAHLEAIYACGAKGYHFGAPMDMAAALEASPPGSIVGGNLDPTKAFCSMEPEAMRAAVRRLKAVAKSHPGFFLSSGCDIPGSALPQTIMAFFEAAAEE
jgi:uroporphyrinogen decarboxylase